MKTLPNYLRFLSLAVLFTLAACGGSTSSDTTSEEDDDTDTIGGDSTDTGNGGEVTGESEVSALTGTGSIITSIFESTVGSESALKKVKTATDTFDPNSTCDSTPPEGLNYDISGPTGTYGSESDPVTLASADYCHDVETDTDSTGQGPDDDGLFGSFSIRVDRQLTATCDHGDGTSDDVTITGDGVWRYTLSFVEIYGNFVVLDSTDSSHDVDCTVILNPDGTIFQASCTDTGDSSTITLDSSQTCTLSINDA